MPKLGWIKSRPSGAPVMTDLQCSNLCQHHPPWAYGRPHSSKWAWPSPAPRSLLTTAPYLSEFDPGSEFDRPEPSNQSLAALGNQLTRQSEEPARQAETVSEAGKSQLRSRMSDLS